MTLRKERSKLKSLRSKIVNYVRVTTQITDLSKQTAQMVYKQEETLGRIEHNIDDTKLNVDRAVKDMKEADRFNASSGGMISKTVYIVVAIVIALIFLAWIMPK
jgi:t-SNARE complex subunit (syntaxin)